MDGNLLGYWLQGIKWVSSIGQSVLNTTYTKSTKENEFQEWHLFSSIKKQNKTN